MLFAKKQVCIHNLFEKYTVVIAISVNEESLHFTFYSI